MNTDTKHTKFLTAYKIIIIALSVLSAGLCAVCTALFYDYSPGYFRESVLCSVFSIAIALASLFALSALATSKKTFKIKSPDSSSSPDFLFLIPACGFLFYAISIFSRLFDTSGSYIFLVHAIFAIISFAYFLVRNLDTKIEASLKGILGLISVVCPMLIAIRSYFDYHAVMNSPEKTYLQITMVAFALYIINEARFILGDPYHRLYVALSGIILPISSCYTVNKIFIIANSKNKYNSEDIALCVLMASIAIYTLFRIIYVTNNEDIKQDTDGEVNVTESISAKIADAGDDQSSSENTCFDTNT